MSTNWANDLIGKLRLPDTFQDTIEGVYGPIASHLNARYPNGSGPRVIGINGCQGSGKSTMAKFLQALLVHEHGRTCLILSLDDFYLSKSKRSKLADEIHPLLATRGVPGTHDIVLLIRTLKALISQEALSDLYIPRFDKGIDDLRPRKEWMPITHKPDSILLEGWCIGATPQSVEQLREPVNELEAKEDTREIWRRYVNQQLKGKYADIFSMIDKLVVIRPPTTDIVFQWRRQQEQKLKSSRTSAGQIGQSDEELQRFIMHYQRLTEHMHEILPGSADVIVNMSEDRSLKGLQIRG